MDVFRHRFAAGPFVVQAVEVVAGEDAVAVGLRGPGFNGIPGDLETVGQIYNVSPCVRERSSVGATISVVRKPWPPLAPATLNGGNTVVTANRAESSYAERLDDLTDAVEGARRPGSRSGAPAVGYRCPTARSRADGRLDVLLYQPRTSRRNQRQLSERQPVTPRFGARQYLDVLAWLKRMGSGPLLGARRHHAS